MAAVFLICSAPLALARDCNPEIVTILIGDEARDFDVEIARTPEEQSRGLMFRPSMAENAGMLFVMEPERPASFWMRNTMISLDLLFVDGAGVVESIAADAVPFSERTMESQGPVRAVLEINGGLSARLGIAPGTQLIHPAFNQAAEAYRCSE
ncbi:DUF192 domain-containing protein [Rhodobacteraceae bacterium NNCM2]|nr:DUF192 domain-containing protein [Coraliihabitans acroporae]